MESNIADEPTPQLPRRRDARIVRGALFVFAAATLVIFWPFLPWLALAAWFAHFAGPAHARVSRALHGRKGGAAVLTLALFVVIIAPFAAATASLVVDAISLAESLMASESGRDALASLVSNGNRHHAQFDLQTVVAFARQYGATLEVGWSVFDATLELGLGFFVFFTAAFVFLVDGPRAMSWVERNSPLTTENLHRVKAAFLEVGRGLIIGFGLCGLAQAVVSTIAFYALGVPRALVLGLVTFFASFFPTLGTAFVWVPVSIGLFLTGRTTEAIILLAIGAIVVSGLDNVMRPILARRGKLELHSFIVLLAMLGGFAVFGGFGLLLGPIVVRLAVEVLRIARDQRATDPTAIIADKREPRAPRPRRVRTEVEQTLPMPLQRKPA